MSNLLYLNSVQHAALVGSGYGGPATTLADIKSIFSNDDYNKITQTTYSLLQPQGILWEMYFRDFYDNLSENWVDERVINPTWLSLDQQELVLGCYYNDDLTLIYECKEHNNMSALVLASTNRRKSLFNVLSDMMRISSFSQTKTLPQFRLAFFDMR